MWLFMPETPWYYARKEQADKAKKTLSKIYKGVQDYDVDREYNAMVLEIAHERENRAINAQTSWKELMLGTNLVCLPSSCLPTADNLPETHFR